jgi:hypothetical protein
MGKGMWFPKFGAIYLLVAIKPCIASQACSKSKGTLAWVSLALWTLSYIFHLTASQRPNT